LYQPEDLPEVGGLDLLRSYLNRRRRAFSDEARAYGTPMPKGLLLVGVPGTGKSLACKTLAKLWKLPLIRIDVGALMGSLVGQSEANVRQALAIAESAAPCIVWLDELEKGLSGLQSSGASDGGTTARVFGTFLTWMQERTSPVYVVATSNDIQALPAELLRAGRFDDIVFVDLPNPIEREEIWRIHLGRVSRDAEAFDVRALVAASEGYTGAEIEASIGEALYAGFDEGREIETADLIEAIKGRVPLTVTMSEQIDALRAWAARRAKPASSKAGQGRGEASAGGRSSRAAMLDA
jgi:SpoVK/Ycf46/Vps4 family AAA+-type ATPase